MIFGYFHFMTFFICYLKKKSRLNIFLKGFFWKQLHFGSFRECPNIQNDHLSQRKRLKGLDGYKRIFLCQISQGEDVLLRLWQRESEDLEVMALLGQCIWKCVSK